jgi:hypothetical protein
VKGRLPLTATLFVLVLAVGASTAAAIEWVTVPPEVKPEPWTPWVDSPRHFSPADGHSFRLETDGGFCAGEEPPKIDHVRVVERPKTRARPFRSAVITVFKYIPEHEKPVQTEEVREGRHVIAACAGIGGELRDIVRLKRPLDHLFLYDGSYSPPRQVWAPGE